MFKAAASRSGSGRAVWEDVLGKLFAGSSRTASSTARFSSRAVAPRFTMPSGGAPRFTAARQSVLRGRQQQQRGFRTSQFRASDKHQRLSMGQRLKKLSKDYGKAAVAVYFLLSAIDLPLFFLLVQMAGTERIGRIEDAIVDGIRFVVPEPVRVKTSEWWTAAKSVFVGSAAAADDQAKGDDDTTVMGVETATAGRREEASLATQFALAYAIHKSFIVFRIPLTAAVTPKIVKTLRSWGWNIGKPLK